MSVCVYIYIYIYGKQHGNIGIIYNQDVDAHKYNTRACVINNNLRSTLFIL